MNAVNENMNPENAEKVQPSTPMMAAEHMGKALVELYLQEARVTGAWQKMSEAQQQEMIDRVTRGVKYAVAGAVNTIVTGNRIAVAGSIESIAKKDKIKLTVLIDRNNNSEAMHEFYLADSGAPCQVVLADAAQYLGGMELVQAEPNQPELFSDEQEKPDDSLLWAINLPLITGSATMVPAPSHKDADLYARSIRAKLIELDRTEFASSVYALPWAMNRGEHMRSFNKGNWESMINWFSKLCTGEVEVKPVALLEHAPEVPEHEVDYKPTDGFELVSATKDFGRFVVTKKGLDFIAKVVDADESDPTTQAKSPLGVDEALRLLAAKQGIVGSFSFKETTTEHDELAQQRMFDVKVTFNADNAPEGDESAEAQPELDGSLVCHVGGFRDAYYVSSGDRLFKNQPTHRAALDLITRAIIGNQPCMYEHTGWEQHPIHGGGQGYKVYPAIELTEDHPRIKVAFTNASGYRATCNSKSATSTRTGRGAAENLLKKMAIEGQVVEITTLDDIENEVRMFTVI